MNKKAHFKVELTSS